MLEIILFIYIVAASVLLVVLSVLLSLEKKRYNILLARFDYLVDKLIESFNYVESEDLRKDVKM